MVYYNARNWRSIGKTVGNIKIYRKEKGNKMPYIDGEWISSKEFKDRNQRLDGGWTSDSGSRFKAAQVVKASLEPDIYRFEKTDQANYFVKQLFPTDDTTRLPGLPCDYILDQIKLFWSKEEEYKKFGFVHKRGILLYGEPGCGKTSIVRLLCDEVLKNEGIIFSIDNFVMASEFISIFRQVEPTRPILTVQEDIEGLFVGAEGANQIKAALSFLDGQDQVNNIVHIATTNEPGKIADRFIKRPGRFDLVIGIRPPTTETREAYFRHIVKSISEDKVKELVSKTEGLGLSYLRELASTYLCLGIPLDETLERLKLNKNTKSFKNDKINSNNLGFVMGYDE